MDTAYVYIYIHIYTYMFTYVPPHSFGGWLVFAYLLVPTTYYYQKAQET